MSGEKPWEKYKKPTDDQEKKPWEQYSGVKKKESSEHISQRKPLESATKAAVQNTSLDTEPPTRAQVSVSLGGPTKLFEKQPDQQPESVMYGDGIKQPDLLVPNKPIDVKQKKYYRIVSDERKDVKNTISALESRNRELGRSEENLQNEGTYQFLKKKEAQLDAEFKPAEMAVKEIQKHSGVWTRPIESLISSATEGKYSLVNTETINLNKDVEDKLIDTFDDAPEEMKQKWYKGQLPLDQKEHIINVAKTDVLNTAYKKLKGEVANFVQNIKDNPSISTAEKLRSQEDLLAKSDAFNAQVAMDFSNNLLKNNFKATEEDKNLDEAIASKGKGFLPTTLDFVSRLGEGVINTGGKALTGIGTMALLGGERFNQAIGISNADDYTPIESTIDLINDATNYNWLPSSRSKEGNILDDKGKLNLSYQSITRTLADTLPFTMQIMNDVKKGRIEGSPQSMISQLINPKKSKEFADKLKVVETAYKVTIGDNYREAKDMGMDDSKAFTYANVMSLAEGVSENIMPDFKYFDSIAGSTIKDAFKGSLKSAATKQAVKNVTKEFFKDIASEIGEEEFSLAVEDGLKYSLLLNHPNSEFFNMKRQKELIASTVIMSGATGLRYAPEKIGQNRNDIYREVYNNIGDLQDSFNQEINSPLNDEKTKESLKIAYNFASDVSNAIAKSPENVTADQIDLLVQKNKLEEKKKTMDPAFHPDINEEIAGIDVKIRELSKVPTETAAPAAAEVTAVEQEITPTPIAVKEENVTVKSGQKVSDVLNRPAVLESFGGSKLESPLEGDVYQEGQRVIFEDKNKKTYYLGNIDEISDSAVEDLGLKPQDQLMIVTPEGKIKVGDNTWNIQEELPTKGIEYDKDGNVKAVSLKDDTGKTVMYEGQLAEDIAYQALLKDVQTEEQKQAINEILENDEELNTQLREAEEASAETTGEVVEPGVAEVATEEVVPSEIEVALDDVITPASKNIKEQVSRAKKAISKILPNVDIIYHDTEDSYEAAVGDRSNGAYENGVIHINGSKANSRTVAHEVFHAVILKSISTDKQATDLTNRMFKALAKTLKGKPELLAEVTKFSEGNYSKELWSEEKLAEIVGQLAAEYDTLPSNSQSIIKKWIDKIAKMFGIKQFTDQDVVDFMNTIATKVATGQEITESDVKNITEDSGKTIKSPISLITRKSVGAFDVVYTEQEKIDDLVKNKLVTQPNDVGFMSGKNVAITSPDDMLAGSVYLNGKEIFKGGGGVFFVTMYGDVWASGSRSAANTLKNAINNSLSKNKDKKGYLVLTKGSDSKLLSSSSGVNSSLSILESMLDNGLISLSDFRSAVSSAVKVFGGEISLRGSAKQLKEDVNKYFSNPKESTFQKRGDVLKKIIETIAQSKNTKTNKDKIIDFLGGDKNKGIVSKVTNENKNRNQSLSDLIAGIASEKLTKGLNVGDVYAIIEVSGEVDVKEDSHPSYPFHIVQKDGKKPILHLPKIRENGSKTIITSSGKAYSVGNVSIMSGSFNEVSGRKQISPENSSNYANMTEDGKGNFVFYHFGPRGIKSIDPKRYGSNKGAITSKPEVAAMGRVGGMSQFYTNPEYSEHNVSGDKYMIKIPVSKVYDFNTDPDNLYDRAKELFKKKNPDMPFTANDQLAYITKLAEKEGYDMTVAEWNNRTRAQSTKELKPVDVQIMDGNTISKPFDENYESNASKGYKSEIPVSKEVKLKEVYDKIYTERNSKNKYDGLYRLAENFPKMSQDEITDMIDSSDISQELKDEYASALSYEPGTRKSSRRQVSVEDISNNTRDEVDRVKSLPIESEDGATFNLDGTKYEGGGLVVPVVSLEGNTSQEKLSPEMIGEFTKDNEDKVGDEDIVKVGIYKFPKKNTVSIDMNIVIPREHRSVALEFGRLIGQESLFDLDTYENVKTGADGLNPVKLTSEQFREAAASLKNGVMPTSVSTRRQINPIDEAVEKGKRRGFDNKMIADYLVSKGYTRAQATNAIIRYEKGRAVELRKKDSVFTKEGRSKIPAFLDGVRRRWMSARSFMPKSVFLMKDKIESNIKAEAKKASYLVDDFNRLVKNYKGDIDQLHDEFDKYLRGDQTAVLPKEFREVAGKMRMHIDNMSQMLLKNGAVTLSQAETIANNLGQYVNRSYQVFDKKNWAKQVTDEMKETARADLRNMYRAEAESKAKATGLDADVLLEDFINKKIDELISGESAATFLGIGKTGSKDLSIMKQRTDIPLSIRQLMGEYTDVSQNYARTILKIATLAENARFLQSAREAGMGVFFYNENDVNRPAEFNTKIAGDSSQTMNPLNGLYTTKEIADAFKQKIGTGDAIEAALGTNIGPLVRSIYTTYMKALSSVKWLKTIGSVATHFKNVTGNIWFMLANGYYSPKKYAEAFSALKNSSNEDLRAKLDEYIRAGIIDQSAALGEIRAMFDDADFDTAIESRLKKNPYEKVKSEVRKIGRKMSTAYQLEDDFFKIISYENEKARYANTYFDKPFDQLTDDQKTIVKDYASEVTKNILPNYARIPGLVKLLKAVPVTGTFVSFQAEAYRTAWNTVALAADELKSDNKKIKAIGAKRLAGIAMAQGIKFGLMAMMGTIVSGGSDDDDDELKKSTKMFVAPWSKDSDIVLVDYGKGKMSYIDFSSSDPHGGIKKAYNSIMKGDSFIESFTNGLTQLLEPFVKEDMLLSVITDIKDNKNSYGGSLYNESDTDVNKVNAIMNRVYKAFEPGSITSVRKVIGADDVRNELAGQLTGYKINTVDVNNQLGFKMNDLKNKAGEAKKLYNSAYYKFEDKKITGEELDAAYDQANESQKKVYQEMMYYMKAASFLGVDDYDIEDNMKGVSKEVMSSLWYGEAPDMKYKGMEE